MSDVRGEEGRITLRDGRTLGYAGYGDPGGVPLFFFHGTPGCRFRSRADDPAARELGMRVIMPERPGYGLSDPHPRGSMPTWADDVAQLADRLGIGAFGVAGASGGGPFVAACAHALAPRLTCAVMVSSASPVDAPEVWRTLSTANRLKFLAPRHAPWLLRWDAELVARLVRRRPEAFVRLMAVQMSPADRRLFHAEDRKEPLARFLRECFRQGAAGLAADLRAVSRPWGFDPAAIRMPVHVWHGEDDGMAPVAMGRYLARTIPRARARFFPGEGHLLVASGARWRELLETVAGAVAQAA
ncbi:MAG TPA: alpha/beta hydrolase [Longimicrobiaceae bacterium]|nr:alpha/beta hydrolase [Longimicrobiaceae bacterium]